MSRWILIVAAVGLFAAGFSAMAQEPGVPPADMPPADMPAADVPVADIPPAAETPVPETPAAPPEPVASATGDAPPMEELTLWAMIRNGGPVLWIINVLSVMTVVWAVYLFLTVTPGREVPQTFVKRAMAMIKSGDLRGAYQMCEGRDELVANVLRAGLKVSGHDRYVIQEAMESEGERGATELWQRISYLNNVGVIAPLLGLLGTVWGMIGAFGAIAMNDASAKGLTMAYSVAQAMITTAAGLMLAIPAMVLYFYLRSRVVRIIAQVEAQASEMVELLSRSQVG
jgi:biopolymer transport protein ExbB